MYVCKRCWKYAQFKWRDLKLPCNGNNDTPSCRGRDRILEGKHPDPYNAKMVSNLRTLSENQRDFAAYHMACVPSLRGRTRSTGGFSSTLLADMSESAKYVPSGPLLVRAPENIRASASHVQRENDILRLYGVSSKAEFVALGRDFLSRTSRESFSEEETEDV